MIVALDRYNVAAFDIATKHTGVCTARTGVIEPYTINAEGFEQWFRRFTQALDGIDIAIIEGYAYNGNRVTQIAEVVGIFKAVADVLNIPIVTVPIATWRSFNEIKGKKDFAYHREQMEKHGLPFKTVDEVDAYLIYRTVLHADEVPNITLRREVEEVVGDRPEA